MWALKRGVLAISQYELLILIISQSVKSLIINVSIRVLLCMFLIPPYSYNQLNHFALRKKSPWLFTDAPRRTPYFVFSNFTQVRAQQHILWPCFRTWFSNFCTLDQATDSYRPFVRLSVKELTYTFRKFVMGRTGNPVLLSKEDEWRLWQHKDTQYRETALLYYVKCFSNVPTFLKTKVSQWQQLVLAWQHSKKLVLHCDHPDGKFIWDTVISVHKLCPGCQK